MSTKGLLTRKERVYRFVSVCLHIYLALAAVMFILYLGAPLLGGRLFPHALIICGSWIIMASYSIVLLQKKRRGRRISLCQFLLLGSYTIACAFLWFPYPLSLLFSVLSVVGIAFSYNAQQKREGSLIEIRTPLKR
jgi:hypothetical protein